MKKDFTQSFEKGKIQYEFLVRSLEKFFIIHPTSEYEDAFYRTLYMDVEDGLDSNAQIVKFMESYGFSPTRMRELAQTKSFAYSFIDETPGMVSTNTCLLVDVDVHTQRNGQSAKGQEEYFFLPLQEFWEKLSDPGNPLGSRLVDLGVKRLLLEEQIKPDRVQ